MKGTTLFWIGAVPLVLIAAASILVIWPGPLFAYSVSGGRLAIASDLPIPPPAADRVPWAMIVLGASPARGQTVLGRNGGNEPTNEDPRCA